MHDELTAKDIEKMQEELDHRRIELRPQLIEEVKRAREYGDLSENFEYKEAKRAKNRNDSRIRYLQAMIKTAVVIEDRSEEGIVGLYDARFGYEGLNGAYAPNLHNGLHQLRRLVYGCRLKRTVEVKTRHLNVGAKAHNFVANLSFETMTYAHRQKHDHHA